MAVSVFVGVSVDGFMARPDGALDWLPAGGGEPHGYEEFIASVDALVIGRNTFEIVQAFDTWPYGDKRVVVLSRRPIDFSAVRGGVVEQMAGPPAEIVAPLAASRATITSMSTAGSRSRTSFARASSSDSSSPACPC